MPRAKHGDDDQQTTTPDDAPAETVPATRPEPAPQPTTAASEADVYEPYPGESFFHGGRTSPIIRAMGARLAAEGHVPDGVSLGADWTNAHRRAVESYQRELRPREGGDVSGIPDETAWRQLKVPRVSPRTTKNAEASA